jgi:outer membrane protein insertion porin family
MKRLLIAVLFLLAQAPLAYSFEPFQIQDIRVEGIQRTEAGTVFSYLPVKVGDTMNDEKAAAAIKTLFATGFFKDVRLEIDGQVLVVVHTSEETGSTELHIRIISARRADPVEVRDYEQTPR